MNLQDLKTTVPALFQTEKLSKLSDRYTMVPTIDVVDKFIQNGWEVSSAKQVGRTAFAKHQVCVQSHSVNTSFQFSFQVLEDSQIH